jgi:1,4-dihydroxy-2-naphthoyl-CoA synthase
METLRVETHDGVRSIVLTRAAEYNTITPRLRDELAAAIDDADADASVGVILLRAEGPRSAPATASTGRPPPSTRRSRGSRKGRRRESGTRSPTSR